MINKVYVIIGSSGSFDNYTTFIEGIFDNPVTAEETKNKINSETELRKIEIKNIFIERFKKEFDFDDLYDDIKALSNTETELEEYSKLHFEYRDLIEKNNSDVIEFDFNKRIELKNYF